MQVSRTRWAARPARCRSPARDSEKSPACDLAPWDSIRHLTYCSEGFRVSRPGKQPAGGSAAPVSPIGEGRPGLLRGWERREMGEEGDGRGLPAAALLISHQL